MADTTSTRASALSFRSTTFEIVDQHGQPWLKASDIARALGYAEEDAISRIYRPRADEFTSAMTQTVNLTVSQNNGQLQRETRIFSLRGAHLLAMFARTSVAKEFRTWVLDVLEQQTSPYGQPAQDPKRIEHARQLAHAATAQVYQAVFDAALNNNSSPYNTRLLLGFTGTTAPMAYVQALENGTFAMTLPQLTKAIRTDLMVSDTALANLAAACTQRMAERAEFEARRSAKAQGQLQIQ